MGGRRKLVQFDQTITLIEDKASNDGAETESGVERLHLHGENSNSEKVNNHGKNSRAGRLVLRRSNRIKSLPPPINTLGAEPEHVNLDEDEKEQDPAVNGRNLEEKLDYLVKTADDFKSKGFRAQDEGACPEISYKSLYFDSQKKIEALMEENYGLVRKLEFARGKIAAYEVMKNVVAAPKEVILVPTDIAAGLSPPPPPPPPPAADGPKPKKMCRYKKLAFAHGADDPKRKKINKKLVVRC